MLTYQAASYLFNFNPVPKLTSMAKGYSSEVATFATQKAIELLGPAGLTGDVERFYRDAKIMEIWEGTSEVEKLIIYRSMLREVEKVAQ